jgi:hypothetical protein
MGKAAAAPDLFIDSRPENMKARVLWQSCVVAAVGCLASGVALTQSTVDCSAVAEDKARLTCYDEQAARQKQQTARPATAAPAAAASSAPSTTASPSTATASSATAAPPAVATRPTTTPATSTPPPVATAIPPPARASSATSDFGLNADAIRKRQEAANPNTPKEPDQIVARVKAVATKARGEYRITLEDGQVWEETQHSSNNLAPNVGETVTIKRGLLGSYFLSHSAGLALRVKRTD